MSRIGRKPIPVPSGVTVVVEPEVVHVTGPRGALSERKSRDIGVEEQDGVLTVTRPTDRGEHRALHGLTRSLVANMVEGRHPGLREAPGAPGRRLPRHAQGPRPRARARLLAPGQHPGADGHRVRGAPADPRDRQGQRQAGRRRDRGQHPQAAPPEPYKGKGVRYEGEYVARKVGKRA
jgi:large subunit ribosomal protein L6